MSAQQKKAARIMRQRQPAASGPGAPHSAPTDTVGLRGCDPADLAKDASSKSLQQQVRLPNGGALHSVPAAAVRRLDPCSSQHRGMRFSCLSKGSAIIEAWGWVL